MSIAKKENYLIILCWLVYTCSYIGRLSYNSNINQIGNEFNMTYSQTGLVTTFFFFSYGIGQVFNGMPTQGMLRLFHFSLISPICVK